jgi:hypothetical protein
MGQSAAYLYTMSMLENDSSNYVRHLLTKTCFKELVKKTGNFERFFQDFFVSTMKVCLR